MNWIKKIIAVGALALGGLYASGCAPQAKLGFNALESAAAFNDSTDDWHNRERLFLNVDVGVGKARVGYHGLHDVQDGDRNTYFGNNRIHFGVDGLETRLAVQLKTDKNGINTTRAGIRDYSVIKKLGGYGQAELYFGDEDVVLDFFIGKIVGKGNALEFFQNITVPYDRKTRDVTFYNEFQFIKWFGKHFGVFGRVEVPDFDFENNRYLGGVIVK